MTATAPIAIEQLEDAFVAWLRSTGAFPYLVEAHSTGHPEPPAPAVQVSWGALVAIGQPELRPVPSIMRQRITVTAPGPGVTGVDFRLGFDLAPTAIEATLGPGDDEAAGALLLLAELAADLPAEVTAVLDPDDDTSIIVDGSAAEPLFSFWPTDEARALVTPLIERFPKIEASWSRMTWTMNFRGKPTRGFGTATDLMARAKATMRKQLGPLVRAAGWELKGVLFADATPPLRDQSTAQLALALEGYATIAFQSPAIRAARAELTTT